MKKILTGIAAVALLGSCQQVEGWFGSDPKTDSTTLNSESINRAKMFRDESITKENAYSDLFLDSAALEGYIRKEKIAANHADRMREFYIVRNNQFAWFTSDGLTEQAKGLWSLYASEDKKDKNAPAAPIEARMDSLINNDSLFYSGGDTSFSTTNSTSTLTQRDTLSAAEKDTSAMASQGSLFTAGDTSLIQTELALTAQYVALSLENNSVVTTENFYWLVPRKKVDAMTLADSLLNKQKDSSLGGNNQQYQALKSSLQHYYTAAKSGGWPSIPLAVGLRKGAKTPVVVQLKKRLAATGDYPANDTSNVFTDSLVTAIKAVQEQYGFVPTGQLTDSVIHELNVPAGERVQQILVNMNRALWMPQLKESSHIMVNIPSLELVVYQDTGKIMTMPVIVGKEGSGTMAFGDEITQVVFSPYWNIPQSIVQNEIMPAMQKDPDYLKKKNMEIVKQGDSIPQIRQLPGQENSLGQVKFLFPNSFDIYLHDTPHKEQFAQQNRALSHGCIRVAKPDSLAFYVLRGQSEWTPEKITAAMQGGKEQIVDVKNPVPVAITYYTAWMGEKGKLNFRKDVYGYDKKTAAKMFINAIGPVTPPVSPA